MICKSKLQRAMDGLGYRESSIGTEYIRAAVGMVDAERTVMMCKDVYPAIARAAGTTPARVERCIRSATDAASRSPMWDKEWREMGGWGHPTNNELIRRLARECRVED